MTNEQIFSLCERSFRPQTTMEQILQESTDEYETWNVDHRVSVLTNDDGNPVGMILKLEHPNFDDLVLITLSWDDTYRIRFIKYDTFEVVHDKEYIYFDQLFEVINNTLKGMMKMEFSMN